MPLQAKLNDWHYDLLRNPQVSSLLDHLRWMAALLVVMSHARSLSFMGRHEVLNNSLIVEVYFFLTRFGQEAVILFFVLSGLLIAGKFLRTDYRTPYKLPSYMLDRMTRLLIVLVPAVLVTLLLEPIALSYLGPTAECSATPLQIVGNFVFLQDILVPPLCTNEPLWSLANEFWYYVLFPASLMIVVTRGWARFVWLTCVATASGVLVAFDTPDDRSILIYFPVWLSGLLAWRSGIGRAVPKMAALAALILAIFFARAPILESVFWLKDYLIAFAAIVLIRSITASGNTFLLSNPRMQIIGKRLADASFSLYLIHYPVILTTNALLRDNGGLAYPLDPTKPENHLIYLFLIVLSIVFSVVMYLLFESHTKALRQAMRTGIGRFQLASRRRDNQV